MNESLLTSRSGPDGSIVVLTLNRPKVRNALDAGLLAELSGALRQAEADPGAQVVILTGAGPAFCAGMDLRAYAADGDFGSLTWFYREGISKPTIAALNGSAVGGGLELAIACDLMVAAEDARIGLPEVKRGMYAGGGGTTLAERIPLAVALELGLTGDTIPARRAAELGLVNVVVPADQVLDAATDLAARVAANAPLALAMTKKLIRERRWGSPEESAAVFRSADAREGAVAFAEKRRPAWTGR
jgi:enoyl-CoA hydratase